MAKPLVDIDLVGKHEELRGPNEVAHRSKPGLSEALVREISEIKGEPDWMLQKRLQALKVFNQKPWPNWGPDLSELRENFDNLTFFIRPSERRARSWEEMDPEVRNVFEKLGIPEHERKFLGGAAAMYESEAVYAKIRKELEDQGVIFTDMDTAVREYPDIVKQYFMSKCVPAADNKLSALHGAVWSGGSFVYIPKGVKVKQPLHIYFFMNSQNEGQFEHTLIVAEEDSEVNYIEACSAPRHPTSSLHSAVVEIFVRKGARVRYTSIQNWSRNTFNLNTKRAIVEEDGVIEWIGGTLGAKVSMLYPCSYLIGPRARAEHLVVSFAGKGAVKDGGAKIIHGAPYTQSKVLAKSICRDGGKAVYRGLVRISKGAVGAKTNVRCDALMVDEKSSSETVPRNEIHENKDVSMAHEAVVGRISEDQIFYLMSRGFSEDEAVALVVRGFIEPITKKLPFEYAVELNRLIELEMAAAGAVG
jgi:Fe-S cluster assembly protein SufB